MTQIFNNTLACDEHPNFKLGADTKSSIVKECRITKKKKKKMLTARMHWCQNLSNANPTGTCPSESETWRVS